MGVSHHPPAPADMPYIKNTFLSMRPPRERAVRSISVPPKGFCDPFAREMHTLMYKLKPVERRSPDGRQAAEEASTPRTPARARNEPEWRPAAHATARQMPTETGIANKAVPASVGDLPSNSKDEESGEETQSTTTDDLGPPPLSSPEQCLTSTNEEGGNTEGTDQDLLRKVPRDEQGNLLSIGSIGHADGRCKPCIFAFDGIKKCENGVWCAFCHYPHPAKKRVRLCKKKRMELRRHVERRKVETQLGEELQSAAPPVILPISLPVCLSRGGGQ